MSLVTSAYSVEKVDVLLLSGCIRSNKDLYRLRPAVKKANSVVAVATCALYSLRHTLTPLILDFGLGIADYSRQPSRPLEELSINTLPEFHEFADQQSLRQMLSQRICSALQKAIEERGKASLVVSGGSTPLPLFTALSGMSIRWERVFITLADERWVDVTDKDSNEASVRKHLLRHRAKDARFFGLKDDHTFAVEGESRCEKKLAGFPMPFDIVILGMGPDGHTASLFPRADRLSHAVDMRSGKLCMAMTPVTASHDRMTLTLPALLHSRQIYLHLSGKEKRTVYEKALGGDSLEEMPVRAVLHQNRVPVDVYWAPE